MGNEIGVSNESPNLVSNESPKCIVGGRVCECMLRKKDGWRLGKLYWTEFLSYGLVG